MIFETVKWLFENFLRGWRKWWARKYGLAFRLSDRNDSAPKTRTEAFFSFYDRQARPGFEEFRRIVNDWVAELPSKAQAEIIRRFKSGNDLNFDSALTEVIIHATLLRCGFRVDTHPATPSSTGRPDFLLKRRTGQPVAFVEVTTINVPDEEMGQDGREGLIFDALNKIEIADDLRLSYGVKAYGKCSPSIKKLRRAIQKWTSDHADRARRAEHVEDDFPCEDWIFRLSLMAGFSPNPGGRRIAIWGHVTDAPAQALDAVSGLRNALDQKCSKYGELGLPYLIAVFDRTDKVSFLETIFADNVAEALFGTEVHQEIMLNSGKTLQQDVRDSDGWFGQIDAPKHTNVSAVLIFPQVSIWYLKQTRGQPLLVPNPWAQLPIAEEALPFRKLVLTPHSPDEH